MLMYRTQCQWGRKSNCLSQHSAKGERKPIGLSQDNAKRERQPVVFYDVVPKGNASPIVVYNTCYHAEINIHLLSWSCFSRISFSWYINISTCHFDNINHIDHISFSSYFKTQSKHTSIHTFILDIKTHKTSTKHNSNHTFIFISQIT